MDRQFRRFLLLATAFFSLLLLLPSGASADDHLYRFSPPSVTHTTTPVVTGWAMPGSTVTSDHSTAAVTATAEGWFAIPLELKEGENQVTIQAKFGTTTRKWQFPYTVNPKAPELKVRVPRTATLSSVYFTGYAPPGTKVFINSYSAITTKEDGFFWGRVPFTEGIADVRVIAEDADGNRSEVTARAIKSKLAAVASQQVRQVKIAAPPGSRVSLTASENQAYYTQKPLGELVLKEDGSWSGYLSSILGWTFYHLNVTTPDGQEYTDQIGLVRFVDVVMPDLTNREVLSIPGKVLKGTTLTLNGEPVEIDPADQSFVLKLPLSPGQQRFLLRAEYKEAWSQQYYTVTRIAAPEVYLSSLRLQNYDAGTVFKAEGEMFEADQWGAVDIPLRLTPGQNVKVIYVMRPSGEERFNLLDITYTPSTFVRLQLDNRMAEVNGAEKELPAAPVNLDGFTYVPLRALGEILGAKVDWDGETQTVTYTRGSRVIKLKVGEMKALVDGKEVLLPAPSRLVGSSTFIPLRFISENLGVKVVWNGTTKSITLIVPLEQ